MLAQKPAIAKLIVAFDQFNTVTTGKVEFIRTASDKVICLSLGLLKYHNPSFHVQVMARSVDMEAC